MQRTIYDIHINDLLGNKLDLNQFRDGYWLIANTASECGYTPQLQQLQELHESDLNVQVLGCPCNDFGNQEPGSAETIRGFCSNQYGVRFPLSEKVGIVVDRHTLFEFLCDENQNGVLDFEVDWNFCKFLVDPGGHLLGAWSSSVSPIDEVILDKIQQG